MHKFTFVSNDSHCKAYELVNSTFSDMLQFYLEFESYYKINRLQHTLTYATFLEIFVVYFGHQRAFERNFFLLINVFLNYRHVNKYFMKSGTQQCG